MGELTIAAVSAPFGRDLDQAFADIEDILDGARAAVDDDLAVVDVADHRAGDAEDDDRRADRRLAVVHDERPVARGARQPARAAGARPGHRREPPADLVGLRRRAGAEAGLSLAGGRAGRVLRPLRAAAGGVTVPIANPGCTCTIDKVPTGDSTVPSGASGSAPYTCWRGSSR